MADAGPVAAILDRRDEHHALCREILRQIEPPLLTRWPVVTEAAWSLRGQRQALQQLNASVDSGFFRIVPIEDSALAEMAELSRRTSSLQLQLADLSPLHVCRQQQRTIVFPLDRRAFTVLRASGGV
jgi:predicted nucleic acid-binding protein